MSDDSCPAVVNGVVNAGIFTRDNAGVYALNATTGAKLWNFRMTDGVTSSPVVANGVVYVGSYNGNV